MRKTIEAAQNTALFCLALAALDPMNGNISWMSTVVRLGAAHLLMNQANEWMRFVSAGLTAAAAKQTVQIQAVFNNPEFLAQVDAALKSLKEIDPALKNPSAIIDALPRDAGSIAALTAEEKGQPDAKRSAVMNDVSASIAARGLRKMFVQDPQNPDDILDAALDENAKQEEILRESLLEL